MDEFTRIIAASFSVEEAENIGILERLHEFEIRETEANDAWLRHMDKIRPFNWDDEDWDWKDNPLW